MKKKPIIVLSLLLFSVFVLFAKFDPYSCVWQYNPVQDKIHVLTGACYFNNYGGPEEDWILAGETYECMSGSGTCYAVDCLEYHTLCEFVPSR